MESICNWAHIAGMYHLISPLKSLIATITCIYNNIVSATETKENEIYKHNSPRLVAQLRAEKNSFQISYVIFDLEGDKRMPTCQKIWQYFFSSQTNVTQVYPIIH